MSKRKPGAGRKPNPIPTQAVRLPVPIANKLLELKKRGVLDSLYLTDIGKIFSGKISSSLNLPYFESRVQAGVPLPGDDFSEVSLNLKDLLFPNIRSMFLVRAAGDSMINIGIFPNDILIVDRSLKPVNGGIVIAVLNGEMTIKCLGIKKGETLLCAENEKYSDIKVTEYDDFSIWGVVTNVIHSFMP